MTNNEFNNEFNFDKDECKENPPCEYIINYDSKGIPCRSYIGICDKHLKLWDNEVNMDDQN